MSYRFLQRLQMDMIDFSSNPDRGMKWILHIRDHFSKFSWAYSLPTKQAAGVAQKLKQTFCLFGSPDILQVSRFLYSSSACRDVDNEHFSLYCEFIIAMHRLDEKRLPY